jgi:hypothetical protein
MGALFGQNKTSPQQGPTNGTLGLDSHIWGNTTASRPKPIGEYTAPEDSRGFIAKALDFTLATGQGIVKPYQYLSNSLPYATGKMPDMGSIIDKGYEALSNAEKRANESYKAGQMSKSDYDEMIRTINKGREQLFTKAQENLAQVNEYTSPRKFAAAGVQAGADLYTLGQASAARAATTAGTSAIKNILFGVGGGAVSATAGTLLEDDPTLRKVMKSAAIGSVIGGGIPFLGTVGKATKNAIAPAAQATADALTPYVSKADQIARAGIDKLKAGTSKVISSLPGGEQTLARGAAIKETLKKSLVDSMSPIYDRVKRLEKSGTTASGTADALYLKHNQTLGNKMANEFLDNNEKMLALHEAIGAVDRSSKKALNAVGEYSAALRDLDLAAANRKDFTKKRIEGLQATVKRLEGKYGKESLSAADTALKEANKEVARLLQGTGLSEKQFQKLIENDPNYIRTQRQQSKWSLKMQEQGRAGAGAGSSPIQKARQKSYTSPD